MDPAPPITEPAPTAPIAPIDRAAAAFEVILCSGFPTQSVIIVLLDLAGLHAKLPDGKLSPAFVFALSLLDTVLVIGLIAFFFRARRESIREELFGWRPPGREALVGTGLIAVSFFVLLVVMAVLRLALPWLRNVPHNPLAELVRTPADAMVFAFVVTIAGGVREEVQRAFVLRRFERYLGGGAVGLVCFSLLFGLGHLEQGNDVAIATALLGAFWGAVFLARRSIVAPMVAHAGFNLTQVANFVVFGAVR